MFRYTINPDSEIPVYRQLVDQINAAIRSGALKTGSQLPTVREMAAQMNLSCGTVKRVYDCLREMGDIEMTRRRGTFIKYVREDGDSRKVQAMTAIDRMFRQLTDLNFSPAEIQIFLGLKMREWGLRWSGMRIALVTQYTELAANLERQLGRIGNVRVIVCGLRQMREYPYSIDEESDVILASSQDASQLLPILPDRTKLIKLAFGPTPECLCDIARFPGRLGVACEDAPFVELVRGYLPGARRDALAAICTGSGEDAAAFLDSVDGIILPAGWTCPFADRLREGAQLLPFHYAIDEGSMISLEERINRIRDERQLRPGALRF